MSAIPTVLKRTCTAFAVGFARAACAQQSSAGAFLPAEVGRCLASRKGATTRLFSTFQAPIPPQSKGEAIYNDIDLSTKTVSSRMSDPNAVFVINGASRGIGLQFVKSLVSESKGKIVACCRDPESAEGLHSFLSQLPQSERDRVHLVSMDLENQESITAAADSIKSSFQRVDILLNVAGILGDGKSTPGPERSISKIERDWLEKTFSVNVFGPVMFTKELTTLMAQKKRGKKEDAAERPNAVIANLSARVGSVSDNQLGGWYSYRMSKAALNQATRTMAHELKRQSIWCIALHPGTTDTDLSKPFQKNVAEGRLFPVDFTVESLLEVVNAMDDENSGGLYDWAGKAIPF